MVKVVPRSMAPDAPADSEFPSNPKTHHMDGCKINVADYSCSCGLLTHLLATGAFVRYDASMCRVSHPNTKAPMAVGDNLDRLIDALRERSAAVDMRAFDRD